MPRTKWPGWAVFTLIYLCFVAVFGDFLANEKPLYCSIEGRSYLPVLRSYAVAWGMATWPEALQGSDWHNKEYHRVIYPPVPFSAGTLDLEDASFKAPTLAGDRRELRFRHWLGTDALGRDVLSGLVRGTRISLVVGLVSMLLAALVGIPLGALGGYFGNRRHHLPAHEGAIWLLAGFCALFYLWQGILHVQVSARSYLYFGIAAGMLVLAWLIIKWISKTGIHSPVVRVPWDFIIMRSIEVLRSIPAFFLLFALLGIVRKPSLFYVVVLIAILRCPTIIRYVRAEAMKLRDQTFVDAARVMGLRDGQIIFRHIIPNALGPVFITMAFGVGIAILLESGLSFLGIGISVDQVTWGKMLNIARHNFSAWWMALFPGMAIFLTIAVFNSIGDALTRTFQPR